MNCNCHSSSKQNKSNNIMWRSTARVMAAVLLQIDAGLDERLPCARFKRARSSAAGPSRPGQLANNSSSPRRFPTRAPALTRELRTASASKPASSLASRWAARLRKAGRATHPASAVRLPGSKPWTNASSQRPSLARPWPDTRALARALVRSPRVPVPYK